MALPKCSLQLLTQKDIELVRQWRNQERIRRNMHTSDPISAQQHQAWFNGLAKDQTRKYNLFLQNDRPVGCLYYTAIHNGIADLGYYLGEERVWPGLGLLLELVALDYAFDQLGLNTLQAEVLEFNTGPQKVHKLFGYEQIGRQPEAIRRNDQPVASISYRYRRADWHAQKDGIVKKLPKQIRDAATLVKF